MDLKEMKSQLRKLQLCIDQIQFLVYELEEKRLDEEERRFKEKYAASKISKLNPPRPYLENPSRCVNDSIAAHGLNQSNLNK